MHVSRRTAAEKEGRELILCVRARCRVLCTACDILPLVRESPSVLRGDIEARAQAVVQSIAPRYLVEPQPLDDVVGSDKHARYHLLADEKGLGHKVPPLVRRSLITVRSSGTHCALSRGALVVARRRDARLAAILWAQRVVPSLALHALLVFRCRVDEQIPDRTLSQQIHAVRLYPDLPRRPWILFLSHGPGRRDGGLDVALLQRRDQRLLESIAHHPFRHLSGF
mmetsp:Transcript_57768/g.135625  ORF Transcript_57768/g.135625 Transcript_57768/m.135625 type:complete len:225 (+) Transcript_57768:1226-1900(+)